MRQVQIRRFQNSDLHEASALDKNIEMNKRVLENFEAKRQTLFIYIR